MSAGGLQCTQALGAAVVLFEARCLVEKPAHCDGADRAQPDSMDGAAIGVAFLQHHRAHQQRIASIHRQPGTRDRTLAGFRHRRHGGTAADRRPGLRRRAGTAAEPFGELAGHRVAEQFLQLRKAIGRLRVGHRGGRIERAAHPIAWPRIICAVHHDADEVLDRRVVPTAARQHAADRQRKIVSIALRRPIAHQQGQRSDTRGVRGELVGHDRCRCRRSVVLPGDRLAAFVHRSRKYGLRRPVAGTGAQLEQPRSLGIGAQLHRIVKA